MSHGRISCKFDFFLGSNINKQKQEHLTNE